MDSVEEWVVKNRDKIEKGVEFMGQAAEVLASTVGQLHPILEAVFVASAELLGNPDSKEARYLTQQFVLVNQQLERVQNEVDTIALELIKASMNKQNHEREAQINSQYEKFQEFINAKPKFKEKKMEKFLSHYDYTDGDLNMDGLYNAVTGENISGDPMLEMVLIIEKRSRRAVEYFCVHLKKLFVMGIIAIMGYAALKDGVVGEEIVKKWKDRMEEVEKRMKAAVDECLEKFPDQAKLDVEHILQDNPGPISQEFTQTLLDSLVKKYDWVSWSIRAFNEKEPIFFFNWLAGKKCHGSGGSNWFDLLTKNKIKVIVSFCVNPKTINKSEIQGHIESRKLSGDMISLARSLNTCYPDCLVHAVSHHKKVVEANNFNKDCYYYIKHKPAYLCIHPE